MKRTTLPLPVKEVLREHVSNRAVERMWADVDVRTSGGSSRGAQPRVARWLTVTMMLVAGGAFAGYGVAKVERMMAPVPSAITAPAVAPAASVEHAPAVPASIPVPAPSAVTATTATPLVASAPKPVAVAAAGPRWKELEQSGDHEGAYTQLGPDGFAAATRSATIDELFALADVARLSGHPRDARLPLGRVVDEHASDPRAPLAALTLGRVELTSLGMPGPAAASLEKAIALGLPAGLAGDAYVLLTDAYVAEGDHAAVRRTYDAYVTRFPGGEKEAILRAKLSPP